MILIILIILILIIANNTIINFYKIYINNFKKYSSSKYEYINYIKNLLFLKIIIYYSVLLIIIS